MPSTKMFTLDRKIFTFSHFWKATTKTRQNITQSSAPHTSSASRAHHCLSCRQNTGSLIILRGCYGLLLARSPGSFLQNREQENRTATGGGAREEKGDQTCQRMSYQPPSYRDFMLFVKTLVSWPNFHIKGISVITGNCQDSVHWEKKGAQSFNWEALAPVVPVFPHRSGFSIIPEIRMGTAPQDVKGPLQNNPP